MPEGANQRKLAMEILMQWEADPKEERPDDNGYKTNLLLENNFLSKKVGTGIKSRLIPLPQHFFNFKNLELKLSRFMVYMIHNNQLQFPLIHQGDENTIG